MREGGREGERSGQPTALLIIADVIEWSAYRRSFLSVGGGSIIQCICRHVQAQRRRRHLAVGLPLILFGPSLGRAMASIEETESVADEKFLRFKDLVQRWNAWSGAAEPSSASSREPPLVAPRPDEEAPAADSQAPSTEEEAPTPSPEEEAHPWWGDPAEWSGEWWSEAYCTLVPTQMQPGEQATSVPASSATSAPASSSATSAPAARSQKHHKRDVSRKELIELRNEEDVARDMNIKWQKRGPPPDMAKTWRGQKYRPNTQRWGNSSGKNKKWWAEYYEAKNRGQLRQFLRDNPKPDPES